MVAKTKDAGFNSRLHKTFCQNFHRIREEKGMKQEEVAKRMKVGRVTITELEAGRYAPTLDRVERVARALGTTIAELFSGALDGPGITGR